MDCCRRSLHFQNYNLPTKLFLGVVLISAIFAKSCSRSVSLLPRRSTAERGRIVPPCSTALRATVPPLSPYSSFAVENMAWTPHEAVLFQYYLFEIDYSVSVCGDERGELCRE